MKIAKSFLAALLLVGSIGAGSSFAAAEGVIFFKRAGLQGEGGLKWSIQA